MNTPPHSDHYLIRPIEKCDLDAVKKLHLHCFPVRYGDDFYQSLFTESMLCVVLLEKESNKIIGVASGFGKTKNTDYFGIGFSTIVVFYLSTFGLHSTMRKKGLGEFLLEDVLKRAKDFCDPDCVLLHVKTLNTDAIAFYEKRKFKVIRHKHHHYFIENEYYNALKMVFVVTEKGKQMLERRTSFFVNMCCKCKYLRASKEEEELLRDDKTK